MDGLVEVAAGDVEGLAEVEEDAGGAGVLAEGYLLVGGDLRVGEDLIQDVAAQR
jgi:hypothetical protein